MLGGRTTYIVGLEALSALSAPATSHAAAPPEARATPKAAANKAKAGSAKPAKPAASLAFRLDRAKLRQVRRREGRYLLRTNLDAQQPERLWAFYIQLTEVEQAFKELKHALAVRPIFHRKDERIEAHIFGAFLAYCLQLTLKAKLRPLASGLTPREVIAKF